MPTQEMLTQHAGQTFQLWITPEQALDIELIDVVAGVPMTPQFQCFSAVFALPSGYDLPQAVFRVSRQDEEGWLLLMTPGLPCRDGRKVLHTSLHTDKL
ncbi:hypothetical protein [Pseudomonas sp. 8Z]|uniref:DUF6916 family protein n=1 Tax=Pseudomonas sp. 8Z TaxID=2653166 RepID=UPI001359EE7F|nr:hypothetical protein [Pseudomonas sp. 8Z]